MTMDQQMQLSLFSKAANVYSPGAPIDKSELFAGRLDQIQDVLNAVSQRGQHVVIYGERGVGKTSLTNVLEELINKNNLKNTVFKNINCDVDDDFSKIWHKILREIQFIQQKLGIGFNPPMKVSSVNMANYVDGNVTPEDIRFLFQQIDAKFIIVIDEIDRIKDKHVTALLTDTIKTLSDHSVDVTIVMVGVADYVDQLIAGHRSIERSLVQVHMPRMSTNELGEILDKATRLLDMKMDSKVRNKIIKLSEGLPHYTHLLGLLATQNAIKHFRTEIIEQDVDAAIENAIKKAQQSILYDYHKATSSTRKDVIYDRVLLACALAKTDDLGYFAAADVREPLSKIMGKPYDIPAFSRHLKEFCEESRGPVLQKTGKVRRFRYRFINPMLQPFVIMKGLDKGYISDDDL